MEYRWKILALTLNFYCAIWCQDGCGSCPYFRRVEERTCTTAADLVGGIDCSVPGAQYGGATRHFSRSADHTGGSCKSQVGYLGLDVLAGMR